MSGEGVAASSGVGHGRAELGLLLAAMIVLAGAIGYRVWVSGGETPMAVTDQAGPVSIDQLRARAEASDGEAQPWQELGFAHFQRGNFTEAALAYERAVAIDSDEAVLWSALGEARVMASQRDPMPAAALAAFNRASELDPSDPRARYFLNVQKDLEGDHDGAIAGWLALLAESPAGAAWERDLVRTIEQVGAINDIVVDDRIDLALAARSAAPSTSAAPRGPTQAQLAAAGSIPPSEQRAMAEGMVERLQSRLETDPSDLQGWMMLMRSQMTLGRPDEASAALQTAIASNPGSKARLREEATRLGVR